MFNEAMFREILLLSSGNVNDYVAHNQRKNVDLGGSLIHKFLILKFCCFRSGLHYFFKYARHNNLRCPMMVEVSLET